MMVFKDIRLSFVYTKNSILHIPSFVDFTLTKPVLYTDIYQYLLYQILKTLSLKFRYFPKCISIL